MRIVLSIIFSFFAFVNTAFAASLFPFDGNNFISAGNKDKNISTKDLIPDIDTALNSGLVSILTTLYIIGDIVAVLVFGFMGIKLLTTSPQQKAQIKASLFPYFIGLLLYMVGVPLAVLIINILISFF